MTVVGNSDLQQMLKAAAADIRETVAKHGNVHPLVLEKLEAYIALLLQAGNNAEADKLRQRADAMKKILEQQGTAAAPAAAPAPTPAPAAAPAPTPKPAAPPEPPPDGTFSLDGMDDEEISDEALEASINASKAEARALREIAAAQVPAANVEGDEAVHLYNSHGEHVATAFKGYIFTPEGKNLGRYQADFECFVDRSGSYMGQIYEGNRLVRDANFKYASFNFGDKGNEGDRAGWGKTPDIERTMLPLHLDNVRWERE